MGVLAIALTTIHTRLREMVSLVEQIFLLLDHIRVLLNVRVIGLSWLLGTMVTGAVFLQLARRVSARTRSLDTAWSLSRRIGLCILGPMVFNEVMLKMNAESYTVA